MRDRDLAEPNLTCDRRHGRFVRGIAVTVQKHDRRRADAAGVGAAELAAHLLGVDRLQNFAVDTHAFIDLHHRLVQKFGHDDVTGE